MEIKTRTPQDLATAILANDTGTLTKILDCYGLTPTRTTTPCIVQCELAKAALLAASAADYKDTLEQNLGLVDLLLSRLTPVIAVRRLCQLIFAAAENRPTPLTDIPVRALNATFATEELDETTTKLIRDLRGGTLLALVEHCAKNLTNREVSVHFARPFLQAVFYSDLIPSTLCLSYMASSLRWDDHYEAK